ncbi:hypothetical protein F4780DRAFT_28454 [Xylariomycetidae sp. FL0641]|nr:hypothetical protein F4780DRAFT_28454 [Xylariomycetidae sp. FL0641]
MPSYTSILSLSALLALAQGHSQIINVQGLDDSPNSVGFQVQPNIARNCTSISPCQQDATIIRDAEIASNVVNECGRTELGGNIDIGENTENALAAGKVTQVQSGTQMTVTIHQVNADGAGPYTCDLVEQGNTGIISQNLTVEDNVPGKNGFSQEKFKDFEMKVTMPDNFKCTGSSAGNVCTVRCRNNALAGPFGGCFPVQQVDQGQGGGQDNVAAEIPTAASLSKIEDQVAVDKEQLPDAIEANENAGEPAALSAAAVAQSAAGLQVTTSQAPTQTVAVKLGGSAAADSGNNGNGNGNANNNGNGFGGGFGGGNNPFSNFFGNNKARAVKPFQA